jgi:hypothetical protein
LHLLRTFNRPGLQTLASGLPLRQPEAARALAVVSNGAARAIPIAPTTAMRRSVRVLNVILPL